MFTLVDSRRKSIPWNRGRLVGQKLPLKVHQTWPIRVRLEMTNKTRDLALFNVAIDSKLRASGLVRLKVRDVAQGGQVQARAKILRQKPRRPVQFELTARTRQSIEQFLLGHSKIEITVRYLGIEVDDALDMAEHTEV